MLNHNDVLPRLMGRPPEVNDKFDTVHILQSFNNDRIVPGPLIPKLTNLDFLPAEEEKKKRDFSKVVALLWESADSLFCSRMPVLYFSNYILNE